jgi:aminopeptidase
MDPRVRKLAKLLLHYSLELKKGQLFKIRGESVAMPLIQAAYEEAVDIGAYPYVEVTLPETQEYLFKHGSDHQLKYLSPMTRLESNKMEAFLAILGSANTMYLSGVEPKRQVLAQQSRRPIIMKIFKRVAEKSLSWVGTQFPTNADAQQAGMSLTDYEDFVYRAGHLHAGDPAAHWQKVRKEQERIKKVLDKIESLHIRSDGTDLRMRVKGRTWVSCHGTENFPDGEIFTSPVENSVEGVIRFTYPSVYQGHEVEDVTLELKRGKVIKERAVRNHEFLKQMLDMDKGARYVGEIAIGTNYDIKRFSKNTLFDEKIGGTCHMAVGASIPESGGKNKSALHWDMVCDLKNGGEIVADGEVIYRNGKFTI